MARLVLHERAVVYVLLAVANGKSCDVCIATLAYKLHIHIVACEPVGKGYVAVVETAVGLLLHKQVCQAAVTLACLLQLVNVERCAGTDKHFGHLCR